MLIFTLASNFYDIFKFKFQTKKKKRKRKNLGDTQMIHDDKY